MEGSGERLASALAGIGLEIGIGGKVIFFLIYVHKNDMFTKNEH
jgi:hypothetical protein